MWPIRRTPPPTAWATPEPGRGQHPGERGEDAGDRPRAVADGARGGARGRATALACGRLAPGLLPCLVPVDRDARSRAPLARRAGRGALAARRRRGRRTGRHAGESTPNTTSAPCVTRRAGAVSSRGGGCVSRRGRCVGRELVARTRRRPRRRSCCRPTSPTWSASRSGSRSRKVLPTPSSEATMISPPCIWAIRREMARPRPVPGMESASGLLERWKAENRCTWSAAEMPRPVSSHSTHGVLAVDADLEVDGAAGAAVLDRVAGQVVDDLAELVGVGGHQHRLVGDA